MKVTFREEIEARKAWHKNMYCPRCNEGKYKIHHQMEPETYNNWWVECENCGYEGYHSPEREIAIARWKQAHNDTPELDYDPKDWPPGLI